MKSTIKYALLAVLVLICSNHVHGVQTNITHSGRLSHLKSKGFNPQVIYDIGAYRGTWSQEIVQVFSNAKFYLFEANENNSPYLQKSSFPFFIGALGDREEVVTFYSNNTTGDSLLKEQTQYYTEGRCVAKEVQMSSLKKVVSDNKLPLPNLIKMDVQGAEKLIIQGSPEIIKHAEVVILETKILEYNKDAALISEIMNLMDGLGYRMLDILEFHYLPSGELNELDILFVKKDSTLIKKGLLS